MERKKSLISYEIETKENKIYVNFADGEYTFVRGYADVVRLTLMVSMCKEAIIQYYKDSLFGEYKFGVGLITSDDFTSWIITPTFNLGKEDPNRIRVWRHLNKWRRVKYVNGVREGKILIFNSLMGALLCDSNV